MRATYEPVEKIISNVFWLLQEWIMEKWEKNFYISAIAGANNGSSLVVMSKGNLVTIRGSRLIFD